MAARIPVSTYRLQFNARFTFRDALTIVDYLDALGISDCYASSYLMAVPGSPHGYDVADPTRLNPEIGSDDEYGAWIDALQAHSMGHVLDLVPNHMGIARSANPWWQDVLENGAASRFAHFFDIEWHPVKRELTDKVLIPILGDQYGDVLERQELRLRYQDGAFTVGYYDDVLPIAPDTFADVLAQALERPFDAGCSIQRAEIAELQSLIAACRNLPSRTTRDPELVEVRARDKELVKRRLTALVEKSPSVRALVDREVETLNGMPGQARSFDALDELLNAQSYRLAHWRVASEEINYRRFFDVNQLAALRMEDPEVFAQVHQFALDLVDRGAATGLRVDHVDGLFNPRDYLRRLQRRGDEGTPAGPPYPLYVVVEKILGSDEKLPDDWPVHGTTGYEFAALVNNLFVDSRNERAMDDIYARFIRQRMSFAELAYRSKKQVLHETMSGDINSLGHQLNLFSERNRHFRDFTLYNLISTLKETIACFPVYRTYVTADEAVSSHDRRFIVEAVRCAKRRAARAAPVVFDFIERVLLKQTPGDPIQCEEQARFIGKFQQITSPIAAKGIEDTAYYIYNRLLSLNEVGGDPTRFGLAPAEVHARLAERQRRWPAALSATSTHDTKRGEDVRARLNVLSEIPGAWRSAVTKWRTLNRRHKTEVGGAAAPDANEEYFLYQTLVGAWPFEGVTADFARRVGSTMIKALREAKVHTSWFSPDEEYEAAVLRFVDTILDRNRANPFLHAFDPFRARVAELGIYNSLAQAVIKITAPGIPDFYQGTELWDLNLVDPDNRRPVDYAARRRALACMLRRGAPEELLDSRTDGRVKLFVTSRALALRGRMREVFERGEYLPIETAGARRDCLFAFARRFEGRVAVTCVPRMIASLLPDTSSPPLGGGIWSDTRLELDGAFPQHEGPSRFSDAFTGATIQASDGAITAAELFARFPAALLVAERPI